jgi:hypothetical protein
MPAIMNRGRQATVSDGVRADVGGASAAGPSPRPDVIRWTIARAMVEAP